MKSKAEHLDKRNYDDFNEFFWSRNCLRYKHTTDTGDLVDVESSRLSGPLPGEYLPSICEALEDAQKTFLESWLRGISALYRIRKFGLYILESS